MADLERAAREIDRNLNAEEGLRLKPYLDTTGTPTIALGNTTYLDGRAVSMSDPPLSLEAAKRLGKLTAERYMHAVLEMVRGQCTTNQLVAMVVCAYNIGLPGFQGSTILRQHLAGNYSAAARAFALWNKSRSGPIGDDGKRALVDDPVLTGRRAREAAIYLTPDPLDASSSPTGMPQAVSGESSLVKSPINLGGVATLGTGAATGIGALVPDDMGGILGIVNTVKAQLVGVLEWVGIKPQLAVAIVLVIAGWQVIKWRQKQRRDGWA